MTDIEFFSSGGVSNHNSLSSLQGGTTNEYYHLTSSEYTELNGWLDDVTLGSSGSLTLPAVLILDDGSGDSPKIQFITGTNDDTVSLFLQEQAGAGHSDLIVQLADNAGESTFSISDSDGVAQANIDSNGYMLVYGLSVRDQNISNVGDIALDSITADDLAGPIVINDDIQMQDGEKILIGTDSDGQIYTSSDDLYIDNVTLNKDIYIRDNDGGSTVELLFFDVSEPLIDVLEPPDYSSVAGIGHQYFSVKEAIAIAADGGNAELWNISFGGLPTFAARKAKGTVASPTTLTTNTNIFRLGGGGYDGTTFTSGNKALIDFKANENWDSSNQGTRMEFQTTLNGTTTTAAKMTLQDDGDLELTGNVELVDGKKVILGTGSDGEIYSSSDDIYIKNVTQDKDIIFNINDGGADTEVLRIDGDLGILRGDSSNFPDFGSTTTAYKFGDIYLGTSKDIYPSDDSAGLFERSPNTYITPTDHFNSWSGWTWAGYAGFVTPATIDTSTYPSDVLIGNSAVEGAGRAFAYQSANSSVRVRCTCGTTDIRTGIRMDAGDNDDYIELWLDPDGNGLLRLWYRYAVATAVTGPTQLWSSNGMPHMWYILRIARSGTNYLIYSGVTGPDISYLTIFALGWTATRLGLYHEHTGAGFGGGRRSHFDWVEYS